MVSQNPKSRRQRAGENRQGAGEARQRRKKTPASQDAETPRPQAEEDPRLGSSQPGQAQDGQAQEPSPEREPRAGRPRRGGQRPGGPRPGSPQAGGSDPGGLPDSPEPDFPLPGENRPAAEGRPRGPKQGGPVTDRPKTGGGPRPGGPRNSDPLDSGPLDSDPLPQRDIPSGGQQPGGPLPGGTKPGKGPLDGGPFDSGPLDGGPLDSGPLPDDILDGYLPAFDPDLPLLLLPVRIETKYVLDADPPELRIRIYPDQIHIDADRPQPSQREIQLTQDFWRGWHAAKDEARRKAGWQQFVQQAGAKRAGYLARMLRPAAGKDGSLVFPEVPGDPSQPYPARPALLPHHWLAIGYGIGGKQIFLKKSRRVADRLRAGPDPEAAAWQVEGGGLEVDEGLAWMIDYERAVQAGMAITVPLTGPAVEAADQVQILLVLGIVDDLEPQAASDELARLLDVHARTTGLAFVPQGTPTNNTEAAVSGWTYEEAETAALGERLFQDLPKVPPSVFSDNAAQLAKALGFGDAAFLRRLPHGTDQEAARSKDMRAALFEAVMGTLLRQLLDVGTQNGLSGSAINAAREWFIEHVTGGAPLPALRVGAQPYGILPVRRAVKNPDAATTAGQVERVIALLIDAWRASLINVPTLSGDSGLADPQAEIETAIASILAAQPHPARIFTRLLDEYVAGETPMTIQTTYEWLRSTIYKSDTPDDIHAAAAAYYGVYHEHYPDGVKTIDEQLDLWRKVYDELDEQNNNDGRDYVGYIVNVLESYESRQRPLRWLGLDPYEGVLGEENTKIVAGALWGSAGEWNLAGLVQGANPDTGQTAAEYLDELKRRSETGDTALSNWSPKPLLYQLIELTLSLVPGQPAVQAKFREALENLAALDPEQLEWLLRETLGLGSHRLDAWATSLASERLGRMRKAKPNGLHIGVFGWVTPLRPRRKQRPSEGFIHAPSLAHASTAALLRAGYLAHGSSEDDSPAAVDISSAQVRAAAWLLDGVRQGQRLGDLLGYHFERSLHDRKADMDIHAVRQLVLTAQGKPNAPANQPVDGIELLDLYRSQQIKDSDLSAPAQAALADLEQAFDAVYDVGLFESVHQLAAGNFERATAMMDAVTLGTIDPPELRAPLTPRAAAAVEHRVVILLRPDTQAPDRGWATGTRGPLSPALEAWAASVLPRADQVGFQVTLPQVNGTPGASQPMTLNKLGLSALDAVYLAGDNPLAAAPALQTLAAGAAGLSGPAQIDPALSQADFSLADFTVAASELRRLLETLRPLDARDLRPSAQRGEPGTTLPSQQQAAAAGLLNNFQQMGEAFVNPLNLHSQADISQYVTFFARLGISTGSSPLDAAGAEGLKEVVQRRMAIAAAGPAGSDDSMPGLEARLAALLGQRIPLLGQFTLTGAAGGPVVNVTNGPASPAQVDDWLDAVSRVRADAGRLATLGMLSELMGCGGLRAQVGQDPLEPGEAWAAGHPPAGPGRLSVVAVSGPGGPPAAGQPACGLMVDQWSEAVPVDRQITGVTLQYDAPSNRPPQAWLLAVPPDGETWSLKLVTDTLLQTLEWTLLRAVGPEHLVDFGRAIPTTFVPGNILNWIEKEAA